MTTAMHPQQFHPHHAHNAQVRTASGINIIAGLYLLISAAISEAGATPNAVVFGIIVAILAAWRVWGRAGAWASWLNALIGIWLIISPWVYGYAGHAWMWNTIIVGIVVLVLGIWSAVAGRATTSTPA